MSKPAIQWIELLGDNDELISTNQELIADWAPDEPPLTVHMGHLGTAFTKNIRSLSDPQRRRILAHVESVMTTGNTTERNAVATGYLEAVLNSTEPGFQLEEVWALLGPESQDYCIAITKFFGIDPPPWMKLSRAQPTPSTEI